ncbi:hypothetical protein [Sphaerisporangium corydalis]|uniref:Uncharacterized protein n=1 Tax=Sphaerisporangium corydalis TaxID=1441875 RepID=A0ABV9EJ59_9ACTN|nr:hypothetical protein [Sphaerisporangium corydalis]
MSFFTSTPKCRWTSGIVSATLACTTAICATAVCTTVSAHADDSPVVAVTAQATKTALLTGSTKASYFWDDSSGRMGDTGLPAIGKPMQKGLFASPSWPLGTEGYVTYNGKKAPFFIGDRGPGIPSESGVMLDIDGRTFAELTGGSFSDSSLVVTGFGAGHIDVDYVITKWGPGVGKKDQPVPFSAGAWGVYDSTPASPPATVTPPVSASSVVPVTVIGD